MNNDPRFDLKINKDEIILEANKCFNCLKPTCVDGCPLHHDIPSILKLVKQEKFNEAFSIINMKSCFPDICASICPHEKQCNGHCVQAKLSKGVNIGLIERFVCEFADSQNDKEVAKKPLNKNVAVIGSGPASLAFALTSAKLGYQVTIFEKESHLGGLLYYGIPSFRLNEKYLQNYITKLEQLDVKVKLNSEVGKDIMLNDIISSFDGVFIGIGAPIQNSLQNTAKMDKYVVFAGDFLKQINHNVHNKIGINTLPNYGPNVVIVGGGNAAMDAARSALRLDGVKSVKIIYRRTEKEMPAYLGELNDAKEEGVEFLTLLNPVKFNYKNDRLESVECAVMELGEKDASGRSRPIESKKEHLFIKANTVILALGSKNDTNFVKGTNIKVDEYGRIVVDENNKTSISNVFAGGDAVTGPLTVVNAMKAGINAAINLNKELIK